MIGRIRAAVTRTVSRTPDWDNRWDLEPESDGDEDFNRTESAAIVSKQVQSKISLSELSDAVLATSIAEGGRHGKYRISVWWLLVIKAQLEGGDLLDSILRQGLNESDL